MDGNFGKKLCLVNNTKRSLYLIVINKSKKLFF